MANISIVSKVGKNMGSIVYFFPKAGKIIGGKFPYFSKFGNKLDKRSQYFPNVETQKEAQLFPRTIPYL